MEAELRERRAPVPRSPPPPRPTQARKKRRGSRDTGGLAVEVESGRSRSMGASRAANGRRNKPIKMEEETHEEEH